MVVNRVFLLSVILIIACVKGFGQCNALTANRSIDFKTNQECAPVTVSQFELTYNFGLAQDPNSIEIVYQWNDPTNRID
ncbi:MAG: hypothetical protein M3Y60_12085, partial [Bacteroidota bacterium]|nr:hypothetical protein [Bacteroidota bacterium]